jgi:ABC-type antimicrobial peptide transport system permease subunit
MYVLKTLLNQYLRSTITVFGIALCVVLMLFLLSIYKGSADGSVQYVRSSNADIWVLQNNATNILRNTSLLPVSYGKTLQDIPGVKSVAPVLFLLASIKLPEHPASIYLTGFDLQAGNGGPPSIIKGKNISRDEEIVLDHSFAGKYKISVGDKVLIKNETLVVSGLSSGTNMFVLQYAFITLKKAKELMGFPGLVSVYQVNTDSGVICSAVIDRIKNKIQNIAVFDKSTFLANNEYEMKSGILPLLYVVAVIGAIILTALLSLILTVNVLEQRKDYAIMKAIGASVGFIPGLVIKQALILAGTGMILAIILFFPLIRIIEKVSPEISAESSVLQIIIVMVCLFAISLISSVIPNLRLRHIYPMEVFQSL